MQHCARLMRRLRIPRYAVIPQVTVAQDYNVQYYPDYKVSAPGWTQHRCCQSFLQGSTCLAAWQCTICCPLAAAHAGADGHVALCPNPYVCKRAEQPVEIYYAERPAACCIHLPQITARAAPFESKPCLAHTAAGARYQQVLSGMVIVS